MSGIIRFPLFFLAFILLGLLFGYFTFKLLSFSRTVEVPALVNMSLLEANEALNRAGLFLKIEGEDYDPAVPAGAIIRQDVPGGNKVKEKRAIKVVVSKGPRVLSLPLLVNETLADAEALLLRKGLRIARVIHIHSDSVERGRIAAQRPEPDEKLTDAITVLVSLGMHEVLYYCPDFTSRTVTESRELAEKLGLIVETRGTGNRVETQKPNPGSVVKSGEKIYLALKEEDPE